MISKASSGSPLRFLSLLFIVPCAVIVCSSLQEKAQAQQTANFRAPLVYGYQADPMMTYWNGYYYLYVDDQLGYDRMRKSASLAGIGSAASEVIYVGSGGVKPGVNCVYLFHWNSRWYQYCGNGQGGTLVLESSADDPVSTYSLAGQLDAPPGFTGYAEWPILVGSQIYMLITTNGDGTSHNSIYAAKFSDPVTRTGSWSLIAVPNAGSGSWECGDGRCIDEGGSAVVHGNNVYLLFSAGGYESPDYCVGMLTASTSADLTVQSSWTKSSGCVIARNDSAGVYGPGSALWFKSPDGTQDWIAYHVKTSTGNHKNGDDRKLEAMQVTWDGNGNPVFSSPYAVDTYHALPSGDPGNEFSAPSVSSWGSNRLTVHAIGIGNNIYEDYWTSNGGWSGWHQVGVTPPNGAALGAESVSRESNYIDMFVPTDSLIYRQTWDGLSWSSWVSMGGPNPSCCIGSVVGSRAAAASWGSDRVDLFSLGLDHGLWQNTWTSETGYSGWLTNLGYPTSAEFIGDPAAFSRAANYIDVFMRGNNGDIYTETWNGSAWSGWTDIGSCPPGNASSPSVASWSSTNLQVYERGRDGNIYQIVWNGTSWGSWTSIGAPSVGAVSDPSAYSRVSNWVDVFTRGADGKIYSTYWNGTSWSAWSSFGEP